MIWARCSTSARITRFGHGVYLVGGGTHPGSGLPVIYEGARISAKLLLEDLAFFFFFFFFFFRSVAGGRARERKARRRIKRALKPLNDGDRKDWHAGTDFDFDGEECTHCGRLRPSHSQR